MCVLPNSLIVGNTRNGRFTPSVIQYLYLKSGQVYTLMESNIIKLNSFPTALHNTYLSQSLVNKTNKSEGYKCNFVCKLPFSRAWFNFRLFLEADCHLILASNSVFQKGNISWEFCQLHHNVEHYLFNNKLFIRAWKVKYVKMPTNCTSYL